jgi:hypothetical protein
MSSPGLPASEYEGRRASFLSYLDERDMAGLVVFSPNNVSWFSRFGFIATGSS